VARALANTSFAIPQLCVSSRSIAFYPIRSPSGKTIVFSYGVFVLALLSGALLLRSAVLRTPHSLFAIGAFWRSRCRRRAWCSTGGVLKYPKHRSMWINGIGAVATA